MIDVPELERRIRDLGRRLVGRLDQAILDDALEYIDHGECRLAVEVLCEQLYEYEVSISTAEADALADLLRVVRSESNYSKLLKELSKPAAPT